MKLRLIVSADDLEELYRIVKDFTQSKQQGAKQSLMSGLRGIEIDAPEDFAAKFDLYASGEKCAEPDLRWHAVCNCFDQPA